jgi:hypothetical protein
MNFFFFFFFFFFFLQKLEVQSMIYSTLSLSNQETTMHCTCLIMPHPMDTIPDNTLVFTLSQDISCCGHISINTKHN